MNQRKIAKILSAFSIAISFSILPIQYANAGEVTVLSNLTQNCSGGQLIRSNVRAAFKFVAASPTTINTIQVLMSDASQGSGTSAIIYADNNGIMSTILGTLAWSSYNASTKISKFVGAVNLPSATYYWLEIYYSGANIYTCYTTSTSLTSSTYGWNIFQKYAVPPNGGEMNASSWWIMSMSTTIIDPPTISTPTFSGQLKKGAVTPISVSINTAGRVQFFANGKRIPKCVSVPTTGTAPSLTATCNWLPSTQGSFEIAAKLIVDSATAVTSGASRVAVARRTTLR